MASSDLIYIKKWHFDVSIPAIENNHNKIVTCTEQPVFVSSIQQLVAN